MARGPVEIVRGVYDAFARRDNAAPFAAYALDIEMDFRRSGFDAPSLYEGHEGVRSAFRDWLAPFREFEFAPGQTKHHGDHVLVTVDEHGIGRAAVSPWTAATMRSGRCAGRRS
jgi:ketosteroid isomerase-like protein